MKRKREMKLIWLDEKSYNQLPSPLKEQKLEYQQLYRKIKLREKHLRTLKKTYDKKREDLIEWKKLQAELYKSIIPLHSELVPTISISYSGNSKGWGNKNSSWSITMRLKGKMFNPYIGTDKDVRIRLNELENTDEYWNEYNFIRIGKSQKIVTNSIREKNRMSEILKSYIEPNIIKKLVELNTSYNGFEEWCRLYNEKKIKGMEFLTD